MATEKEFLLESNRAQTVSETDDFTPERYQQMLSHLPPSARLVMDMGCNTGRGGAALKSVAPAIALTGVDCLQERIDALDQSVYQQRVCSFSTRLPFPVGCFDAIVAGEFIEHVPPGDIEATLCEFFRILRLHGRLVMTTPNPNYLKNRLQNLSVLSEPSHLMQHYPDCLRQRLRSVGFSRVRIFGSGRLTRYVGQRFPLLSAYGSYLIRADKW